MTAPSAKAQQTTPARPRAAPTRPVLPMLLVIACLLRAAACLNEFWFDEVWSWAISTQVQSPLQILTLPEAQSDNNHPLNTLAMYLIGDTGNWVLYRIPALLCGILTVWLAVRMARARGPVEPLLTVVLLGLSFPLVTYSSEARGYGLMICCAVAAYRMLVRYLMGGRQRDAWAFAVLSALGLLWHLTYLHFLLAAGVWSLILVLRRESVGKTVAKLAPMFALPAGVLVAYWVVFVRKIQIGGAPEGSTFEAVMAALSLTLGGPMSGAGAIGAGAVAGALIGTALLWMWRTAPDEFWFFAGVIIGAPALILALQSIVFHRGEVLQVRYLLVCMTFAMILLARWGAGLFRAGGWRRNACLLGLCAALLGNGFHLGQFMGEGRGGYRAAAQTMARRTPGRTVTVTSDNAFRTGMLLAYYKRFTGAEFDYVEMDKATSPPDWLIVNTLEVTGGKGVEPIVVRGVTYRFDSEYPYYGLSGWTWILYRADTAR